jgi:23S rRNA G2445 N2-methylase RlmL
VKYKFAVDNRNYQDFSSGRVLYNFPGTTAFPVRLASEIYQRCAAILTENGVNAPYRLYDPCCGGAYLLTCIGFLHGQEISHIYASDIDHKVISIAEKNLSLLTQEGLKKRIAQIESMYAEFGKDSHYEALNSALRLKEILDKGDGRPEIRCFTADVTKARDLTGIVDSVNMVITDLPYGDIVTWSGQLDEKQAVSSLLDNILPVLLPGSLVALVTRKKTKIISEKYRRIELFTVGKRQITILQPV